MPPPMMTPQTPNDETSGMGGGDTAQTDLVVIQMPKQALDGLIDLLTGARDQASKDIEAQKAESLPPEEKPANEQDALAAEIIGQDRMRKR